MAASVAAKSLAGPCLRRQQPQQQSQTPRTIPSSSRSSGPFLPKSRSVTCSPTEALRAPRPHRRRAAVVCSADNGKVKSNVTQVRASAGRVPACVRVGAAGTLRQTSAWRCGADGGQHADGVLEPGGGGLRRARGGEA
eukprot:scaffold2266_cov313-Prasinococcus_capsulatus_cf.AAC.2